MVEMVEWPEWTGMTGIEAGTGLKLRCTGLGAGMACSGRCRNGIDNYALYPSAALTPNMCLVVFGWQCNSISDHT